jgi:hypothetical protein
MTTRKAVRYINVNVSFRSNNLFAYIHILAGLSGRAV